MRLLLLLLSFQIIACTPEADTTAGEPTLVYLMRHAEKAPPSEEAPHDPDLSPAGYQRAERLARLLGEEPITAIYSSDFIRTKKTVAPLAAAQELQVQSYDPKDLATLASELNSITGRVVVVGHSNTTPAMVELLGGSPGPPIDDATEFDRLYILNLTPGQPVVTTVLRYGG